MCGHAGFPFLSAANDCATGYYWYTWDAEFAAGYEQGDECQELSDSHFLMYLTTDKTGLLQSDPYCAYSGSNTYAWAANQSPIGGGDDTAYGYGYGYGSESDDIGITSDTYVMGADMACCGCGGGTASLDEGERLQAIDPTDATGATLIDFTFPKTTNEAAPVGAYPFGTGSSLCVDFSLGNQILNSSLVFDADPTAGSVG